MPQSRGAASGSFWGKVCLALLLLLVVGVALPARADGESRYFVDVRLDTPDTLAQLAKAGFDIAGVSRKANAAGVVGGEADLQRLRDMGFVYTVRQRWMPGEGIEALSQYTDPQELSALMDQIVASYPTLARKILLGGPLYEGQSVWALHITKDVGLPNDRPSFIMDAQHHAREVMTPEICRDMWEYLTSRYATDPQVQHWVDNLNIYIVPSVNPDGAMYVFTSDTGWRKNRHPACAVDVNRNYPSFWGACGGSDGYCSSDIFRGTAAGSEPETQAMTALTDQVRPFFSLSYHSYGEYILYPYGCTDPDEMASIDEIAHQLNDMLLNDDGQPGLYATGPIHSTIYVVDGGSIDDQYARHGVYGFSIEVNDTGFQPDYNTWRDITVERQRVAWRFFLDKTVDGPAIRGRIIDAHTGLPLAAEFSVAEVTYTHGESQRHADSRGLYHFLARPNSTYHVTYSMPGYCTITREVTVGSGPAIVDIQLGHPAAPAYVTADPAGESRIEVNWAGVPDIAEYRVFRSLTSGGPYKQIATVPVPATTYADEGVSGGVPYYYMVRAFQGCESPDSAEASATTTGPCTLPPAFTGVAAVTNPALSTCTLQVTWPDAEPYCNGPVTYRVYRSTTTPFTPGPANLIASGLREKLYNDHGALSNNVTYYYTAHAVDAASGAEDTNTVTRFSAPTGNQVPGTWRDDAGDIGASKMVRTSPWSVQLTGGNIGPRVYATGSYGSRVCAPLTSPVVRLQANAVLKFASKYDIETNKDAGEVEVATGPDFVNWTHLATVNYPDALANAGNECGIPPSGTNSVFSRTNAAPVYTGGGYTASLADYANQEIKFRFRFSSDSSGAGTGWWIDDITITNALLAYSCASGAVPTPKEVSPPSDPLWCSFKGADVIVDYAPACGALDTAAFWGMGPIAGAPAWTGSACALGTTGHATFAPPEPGPGDLLYFVLVGQTASREGTYGTASNGTERPEATALGSCDVPQDLGGACP